MKIFRQGDVCLIQVEKLPVGAQKVAVKGDVILAFGEQTGHAHRIKRDQTEKPSARLFDLGAERYLQIAERVALTHEEHSAIFLEAGVYRQAYQHEEKRAEITRVAD
jgi:hypothetical protein